MRNEILLKRLKLFNTAVIAPCRNEFVKRCREFDENCDVCTYEELETYDYPVPLHLVLMHLEKGDEKLGQLDERGASLKKLRYWQLLLFSDDPESSEAQRFAIEHRAFGLHPVCESVAELTNAVSEVLPALLERLQEQSRTAQLQKIVDMGPPQVLTGGTGKPLFLNAPAKAFFGVTDPGSLEEAAWSGFRPSDLPLREGEMTVIPYGESRLLATLSSKKGKERLYTFLRLDTALEIERRRFVSRLEFIEKLKDKMAQRLEREEPLAVLLVRIDNLDTVVASFGWASAHTIVKEFGEVMMDHFDPVECFGIWHRDMPILLFEKEETERLKERIETFAFELKLLEFAHNVTLSANFVLIEIRDEDLNAMINLIEKSYTGDLSVADMKGFSLHRIGVGQERRGEGELLLQFFTNIMTNSLPVKLLNIYKGLPISTPTRILKVEEGKIFVKTEKIQKFVMEIEKRVVFQSPHLPGDIEAEFHMSDAQRPLAILKNPKKMESSINNRKHTRVTVTSRLPIFIKLGKSHFSGYIHDISINSIAVHFNLGKFEQNTLNGSRVRVSFKLPWENEEGFVNVAVDGKILFHRDEREYHKMVVILENDEMSESYIFDYIYKRQRELVKEIKAMLG